MLLDHWVSIGINRTRIEALHQFSIKAWTGINKKKGGVVECCNAIGHLRRRTLVL